MSAAIGVFIAESYWQLKGLVTISLTFFMPLIIFLAFNAERLKKILRGYIFIGLPLFPIIYLFTYKDAYGFYLATIPLLFIGFPYLGTKGKIITAGFTALVLGADFGARSNIIKFSVPIFFILLYYCNNLIYPRIIKFIRWALLVTPIMLMLLGITGIFNIFKMDEYIQYETTVSSIEDGNIVEENLIADTRTALYKEVLETSEKFNSWIFGRTPAQGNETEIFTDIADISKNSERLSNEVAILNIFTWTGLVGVFLYGLIFMKASWLDINSSNNKFCQIIGLYVAFRWAYSWIEDVNNFSLNYFVIWLMIGICFSKPMRLMTDYEVKIWLKSIFKYR